MKRLILSLLAGLCLLPGARADEGMWLIQALHGALEKRMQERGLKLGAREIYNEEAGGLADAVVSLGFYCSGSFLSEDGLVITNHHCAYADVAALSTPSANYLEDGFWARSRDREIPIPGKEFFVLRKVLDVTEEVEALKAQLAAEGKPTGSRRISSILERKYADAYQMEAGLTAMWSGLKYYLSLYDKYADVRLVAAPPVQVAAFGGDEDNWEWPQHKADFAVYRVYSGGEPLHPRRHLTVSRKGYKEGDFAMVLGYPGHTERYASAAEMQQRILVERPVENQLHKRQMDIVRKWMDRDPAIRMKYSNAFFNLSNMAEYKEGEAACMKRFLTLEERQAQEAQMPDRELLSTLEAEYAAISAQELQKVYYRECLVRGLFCAPTLMRLGSAGSDRERQQKILQQGLQETDPRVEQELLTLSLEQFLTHMDAKYMKPIHRELMSRFGTDYAAMAGWLWENSCLSDAGKEPDEAILATYDGAAIDTDPLYRYIRELSMGEVNGDEKHVADLPSLRRDYVHARYRYLDGQGVLQYPDANSTLRLSFGRVCSYEPWDGVYAHWQSTALGLRQKYDAARYDFAYPASFAAALPPPEFPVNFLTDLDITGGNSGSPVVNARGELIGLAFDGNKESLSSSYQPVDGYNLCVCVDIRYVLWLLEHFSPEVAEEIG
ncbi:MAG: S46 family peptidase [Bacteroidales bacterium]|nr:S46 family peptidase [Bacteroidales bacterium]